MRLPRRPDCWLFLTPEIEREAPRLLAALGAAAGRVRPAIEIERDLDRLVVAGDEPAWFAFLRDGRRVLEGSLAAGGDRRMAHRLGLILLEQYLLAPSVHVLDATDEAEVAALRGRIAETRESGAE